jgi:acetyl-CoA carboxylase biotin carboxyl carrier protein
MRAIRTTRQGASNVEELRAPMVGRIIEVLVEAGAQVEEEDEVLVLESMKMQIPIAAPRGGTISDIRVKPGDTVQEGDILLVFG